MSGKREKKKEKERRKKGNRVRVKLEEVMENKAKEERDM